MKCCVLVCVFLDILYHQCFALNSLLKELMDFVGLPKFLNYFKSEKCVFM